MKTQNSEFIIYENNTGNIADGLSSLVDAFKVLDDLIEENLQYYKESKDSKFEITIKTEGTEENDWEATYTVVFKITLKRILSLKKLGLRIY